MDHYVYFGDCFGVAIVEDIPGALFVVDAGPVVSLVKLCFIYQLLIIVSSLSFLALLIYASVIYHRARKAARRGQFVESPAMTNTAHEPVSNPFHNAYAAPPQPSLHSMRGEYTSGGIAQGGIYQPPLASPEIRRYA
jgi:hypothetical protein